MNLTILCATLDSKTASRVDALERMRDSIDVPCEVRIEREPTARGIIAALNEYIPRVLADGADVIQIANDDFEFMPGALALARDTLTECFLGTDGVVGLEQANVPLRENQSEFGCLMVGREFLSRFGAHQTFCPEYFHFYGDTELGLYAKACGRFIYSSRAQIIHHHPAVSQAPRDATYAAARTRQAQDNAMWTARQRRGLLWGASFERAS